MSENNKTIPSHLDELAELRQRVSELESELVEHNLLAESAQSESEERYRVLFEYAPDAIYLIDFKGVFLDGNRAAEEMIGSSRAEIIGQSIFGLNLVSQAQLPRIAKLLAQNALGKPTRPEVFTLNQQSGSQIQVEISAFPIKFNKRKVVLGIARDITDRLKAENALRESEEKFRNILEASPMGMHLYKLESDGRLVFVGANPAADQILGVKNSQFFGKTIEDAFPSLADTEVPKRYQLAAAEGKPWHTEQMAYEDGQISGAFDVYAFQSSPGKMVALFLNITARKQAEIALKESEEKLIEAQRIANLGHYSFDITTGKWTNSAELDEIFEIQEDYKRDLDGWLQIVHPEFRESMADYLQNDILAHHHKFDKEYKIIGVRTGQEKWVHGFGNLKFDDKHDPIELFGTIQDITERKLTEEKLHHLATHDSLTDLPNRGMLIDHLSHALLRAARNNELVGVLYIDIDDYKAVNDAFGHKEGDRLLQSVAQRVKQGIRESDMVGRIGGDEFVVILEDITRLEDISPVIDKIFQAISGAFSLQGSDIFITSSIGVASYPLDGKDADTLLQNADQAMYRAKDEGKSTYRFFSPDMNDGVLDRLELKNQLRDAVVNQELMLYYQPQVNLSSGRVMGVEALLRWQHPGLGLLEPGKFISHAEESGLIVPIGKWALQRAIAQAADWIEQGLPPVRLAVNLSERELREDGLVDMIAGILDKHKLSPNLLELELTENIVFLTLENALPILKDLKALGVRLAVDDFGTGYSTFGQLAEFPFDTLKIDRHFSTLVTTSSNDAAIVKGIVTIAQSLKMDVVAEGVEKEAQLDFFQNLGCNTIQGWYYSKAISAKKVEPFLRHGFP